MYIYTVADYLITVFTILGAALIALIIFAVIRYRFEVVFFAFAGCLQNVFYKLL